MAPRYCYAAAVFKANCAQRFVNVLAIQALDRRTDKLACCRINGIDKQCRLRHAPEPLAIEGWSFGVVLPDLLGSLQRTVHKDQAGTQEALPQAHVVGEACAEPVATHERHPREAALLVGAQGALEAGGLRQLLHLGAVGKLAQQLAEGALGLQPVEGDAGGELRGGAAQAHAQRLAHAQVAAALHQGQGLLDLVGVEGDPLAAHAHQGLLERHQPLELGPVDRLIAHAQLPAKAEHALEAEHALALAALGLARGGAGAGPQAPRAAPPAR